MKISTLIVTAMITLGISATTYAKDGTKLCRYTACKITDNGNYKCHKVNNGPYLKPYLVFSKRTNDEYGVANYNKAYCYQDGRNFCELRIHKDLSCDLKA